MKLGTAGIIFDANFGVYSAVSLDIILVIYNDDLLDFTSTNIYFGFADFF